MMGVKLPQPGCSNLVRAVLRASRSTPEGAISRQLSAPIGLAECQTATWVPPVLPPPFCFAKTKQRGRRNL